MSSVRVKKEEANVPPLPRVQVKKEEDNASLPSLKKKRHGREWLGPPNCAARQLQSRRRTIRKSSPTRRLQSAPPSTRSSRGPWNLPAPGLGRTRRRSTPSARHLVLCINVEDDDDGQGCISWVPKPPSDEDNGVD
jgi:hypothetical protein